MIETNIPQLEILHSTYLETYDMINDCDPHIASWTKDGIAFVIKDQHKFAKEVLPKFFEHKFDTFTRQLSFYGFRKKTEVSFRIFCIHREHG